MSYVQQHGPAVGDGSVVARGQTHLGVAASAMMAATIIATLIACSEQKGPLLAPLSLSQASHVPAPATIVWNQRARALVGQSSLSPLAAGRVYAALAIAQYDAINETDGGKYPDGTRPDQGFGAGGRDRVERERGAIAGASSRVLAFFFPAAASQVDENVRAESKWFGGATHPEFTRGLADGASAATRIIAHVMGDHFTDPWAGSVPTGPGKWINNGPPAGPLFGKVTPYFLTSGDQFRPAGPPAFGSPEFVTDLAETVNLSANRTAGQLAIAQFWNYPNGTPTPLGHWNQVAGSLVESYRFDERGAAHVFALMQGAMMDALIACWDAKYEYWYIRPYQANAAITTPIGRPNHPSYPSGHSCISSAATNVLATFFPNETAQLQAQLAEAGLSRMYGGIHYRFDIRVGEALGRSVSDWAIGVDREVGLLAGIH
jgi:membrane-associated phospholipid phosphatase